MTVSFNSVKIASAPNFTSKRNVSNPQPVEDTVVNTKPEKKGPFPGFRNFYAGLKKFFISAGEYTKGTVKGLIEGAAVGVGVLGVDALRGVIKKTEKIPSTGGKVLAGVLGAVVLGANIFKSYLNVNEKKAEVDHRWQTGHNEG